MKIYEEQEDMHFKLPHNCPFQKSCKLSIRKKLFRITNTCNWNDLPAYVAEIPKFDSFKACLDTPLGKENYAS